MKEVCKLNKVFKSILSFVTVLICIFILSTSEDSRYDYSNISFVFKCLVIFFVICFNIVIYSKNNIRKCSLGVLLAILYIFFEIVILYGLSTNYNIFIGIIIILIVNAIIFFRFDKKFRYISISFTVTYFLFWGISYILKYLIN